MKIKLIVAIDLNYGIGKNNDLMWHLPADMKFFKETTLNHIVVMGRKNYESIPEKFRPLPNRINVVLSKQKDFVAENCLVFNSLEACLKSFSLEENKTIFIIGGGQIYQEALNQNNVEEMLITHVNYNFDADTFFPKIDTHNWEISEILDYKKDDKNKFDFIVKKYLKKQS